MKNGIMWHMPWLIIGCIATISGTGFLIAGVHIGVMISSVALVVGAAATMFCLLFSYCLDDKPQDSPEADSGDEIMASRWVLDLLKKVVRSKVVNFGVPCATGSLCVPAFKYHGFWAGMAVIFIGVALLAICTVIDCIGYPEKEEVKEEPEDGPSNEIVAPKQQETPLEYLATHCQAASMNGLTPCISSIVKRATKLLGYRKDDGVVGEILQAYRIFIEQYVAKAAELIRKYQIAKEYLATTDCNQLSIEIGYLQTDIESGDASAKTTLDEKLTTKTEIEAMRKRQESIGRRLGEIAATLEAMEATVVSAETSDADAQVVRDELQRTLSSTTQAIKETLCD